MELWQRLKTLEKEVVALRDRVGALEAGETEEQKPIKKMCPKCGVKPAYFFHVKHCKADKNNNNGPDGRTSTRDS